MTPAEIATLKALCDAATPGEWEAERIFKNRSDVTTMDDDIAENLRPADAAFIAAARTAVPALLSALEEARAGVDDLRAAYSQATDHLKAAESRADALRDSLDDEHELTTRLRMELAQARARADAAWRAALDAAASEARIYANCESPCSCGSKHRMTRLASTIAALPPPSATPNEGT